MVQEPSSAILNVGDLAKPAVTLIEKISGAVGQLFEPRQIRRVARARADAALISAESEIEITELHQRAALRWIDEEAQRQRNIETITAKALPELAENATPDSIEDDWIVNFFDKCRIVSDDEMQQIWSRVLAGEGNAPGTFSRRTVNFLSDLDKSEAESLTRLCGFAWQIGDLVPLVFDVEAEIYKSKGINFNTLSHLDSIGLVRFGGVSSFVRKGFPARAAVHYYGRRLVLELPGKDARQLELGGVLLTGVGQELAPICGSQPVEGFWEYVKEQWKQYLPESEAE